MNIRPTQPEGPKRGAAERLGERGVSKRGPESQVPAGTPVDQVRISQAVRDIRGSLGAESVPAGELSPDRMRQVLERIQQRFYDRPDVVRDTLRHLTPALESDGDRS